MSCQGCLSESRLGFIDPVSIAGSIVAAAEGIVGTLGVESVLALVPTIGGDIDGILDGALSNILGSDHSYRDARARSGLQRLTDTLTKFVAQVRARGINPASPEARQLYCQMVWAQNGPPGSSSQYGIVSDGTLESSIPKPGGGCEPCSGSPAIPSGHRVAGDWQSICRQTLGQIGWDEPYDDRVIDLPALNPQMLLGIGIGAAALFLLPKLLK